MNEKVSWDDLRLFLAVSEHGGLSGAAAILGTSAPTLGRRMVALEQALGKDLFLRHARGYDLTEAGEALRHDLAAAAQQIAQATEPSPRTTVKLSAGFWTTRYLCQFAAQLSDDTTTLRFVAADHVLDIGHREAVIGVRNHRPEQTTLAARRVGRVQFAAYALAGNTAPLPFVQLIGATPSAAWVKEQGPTPFEVTHPAHALDLMYAGVAQTVLPTFVGDMLSGATRNGAVIDDLTHDQWLVSHHTDRFRPEVRSCLDRIAAILRDQSTGTSMS